MNKTLLESNSVTLHIK